MWGEKGSCLTWDIMSRRVCSCAVLFYVSYHQCWWVCSKNNHNKEQGLWTKIKIKRTFLLHFKDNLMYYVGANLDCIYVLKFWDNCLIFFYLPVNKTDYSSAISCQNGWSVNVMDDCSHCRGSIKCTVQSVKSFLFVTLCTPQPTTALPSIGHQGVSLCLSNCVKEI